MDAAAMALRQPLNFSAAAYSAAASSSAIGSRNFSGPGRLGWRSAKGGILSSGFSDQSHVEYYKCASAAAAAEAATMTVVSGKEVKTVKEEKSVKKMKKKQLKLLKGLSKDLSTFSQMGFGLDSKSELIDQIKGNMITEATQLLLEQLQKVKAEEKELKRKLKEEKARSKAAARMLNFNGNNCEMSSSSSSDSSESECGEVIDMNRLKQTQVIDVDQEAPSFPTPIIPTIPSIGVETSPSCFVIPTTSKKIEVCMGGKCKKSGAGAILEEFERVVGIEGAVSGCKCMGKCRDGPNVKVAGVVAGTPPALCTGVGLEDVNAIVANLVGEHENQQILS